MTNSYGAAFAKYIGDNHETLNPGTTIATTMDLYNNARGREAMNFGTVCYSKQAISNAVYRQLTTGNLKYIKNGKLVWSNQ